MPQKRILPHHCLNHQRLHLHPFSGAGRNSWGSRNSWGRAEQDGTARAGRYSWGRAEQPWQDGTAGAGRNSRGRAERDRLLPLELWILSRPLFLAHFLADHHVAVLTRGMHDDLI